MTCELKPRVNINPQTGIATVTNPNNTAMEISVAAGGTIANIPATSDGFVLIPPGDSVTGAFVATAAQQFCFNYQCEADATVAASICADTVVGAHVALPSSFNRHGYATRTAFNASSPPAMIYDANGDITDLQGSVIGSAPFTTESHFDSKDENLMWGIKGGLTDFGSQPPIGGSFTSYYRPPSGFLIRLGPGEGEVECGPSGRCVVLYEYDGTVNSGVERLVSLDLSTSPATILGMLDVSGLDVDKATQSKDCSKILVVSRNVGLISYNPDLTNQIILDPGNSSHADVFETPNGDQYVYTLGGGGNHSFINLHTGQKIELAGTSGLDGGHASGTAQGPGIIAWSPNTAADEDENMRMWLIGDGGTVEADIDLGPAGSNIVDYASQPLISISPDASYAIYSSNKSGSDRDYLIPLDNSACQ